MLLSGGMRNRLRENLAQAGYGQNVTLTQAACGIGQMAIETAALWRTPDAELLGRIKIVEGWDAVLAERDLSRGVIFLTPHLGTFEMASIFIGSQMPLTAMFRAPRLSWAAPMMRAGRDRMQIRAEPADMRGIRAGNGGEGVWAALFGRPAYTMTLAQKLAKTTDALVVMVASVRLPQGAGHHLFFSPLAPFSEALDQSAQELNAAVEAAIARAPSQYLWSYNRYKAPAGAALPPTTERNS
jgi:Kdo2-lipid IVA lauroyltransferase/acyltransferase